MRYSKQIRYSGISDVFATFYLFKETFLCNARSNELCAHKLKQLITGNDAFDSRKIVLVEYICNIARLALINSHDIARNSLDVMRWETPINE